MGAIFKIEGRRAVVHGKTPLSAAAVLASDLRGLSFFLLTALIADGETIIDRVYDIDRAYETIEGKLKDVVAQIKRIGEISPKSGPRRMKLCEFLAGQTTTKNAASAVEKILQNTAATNR